MTLDLDATGVSRNLGGAIARSPALRVDVRENRDAIVLALQGEADLATAPLLTAALARISEHGPAQVVLDASDLEFIDAHCLGAIANARAHLNARGRDLLVRSPAPLFRRVLTILEMEALIEHSDDAVPEPSPALTA